jgi:hypothetical protein
MPHKRKKLWGIYRDMDRNRRIHREKMIYASFYFLKIREVGYFTLKETGWDGVTWFNLGQDRDFVHHTSHLTRPGIEPGPPR